jgi:hypothetical protein
VPSSSLQAGVNDPGRPVIDGQVAESHIEQGTYLDVAIHQQTDAVFGDVPR